jgi:HSP20 family protein
MDLKKLAPWNWFKKEEEHGAVIPVSHATHSSRQAKNIHDPFRVFDDLQRMLDFPLTGTHPFDFDHLLTPLSAPGMLRPHVDIGASTNEYTISVEIPGITEKDISLETTGGTLVIKGEKRQEKEEQDKSYYRVERSYGAFQRMLSLPDDSEHDNITAVFKNGVLTVSIPRKKTGSHLNKNIEIKTLS